MLAARPADATAYYNQPVTKHLGHNVDAVALRVGASCTLPGHIDAPTSAANTLSALSRHDEALADYDKILALRPQHIATHIRCVNTLAATRWPQEALLLTTMRSPSIRRMPKP